MNKKPLVIKSIKEMREFIKPHTASQEANIGFVPTMGYLHEGHLSLVEESTKHCDVTVVSIFVNPKQFGQGEDLLSYPRDLERDLLLLSAYNVDAVFYPEYDEIYPQGYKTYVEVSELSGMYCGKSRPIHFKGVTTVVLKLINIIKPSLVYMGEKDFQQIVILEKMIQDLNLEVKIKRCPILREEDGLAKSSRNIYLNETERKEALCLYHSLLKAKELFNNGETDTETVKTQMTKIISNNNGTIDYIAFTDEPPRSSVGDISDVPQFRATLNRPYGDEVTDEHTLEEVSVINAHTRVLLAVKIGKTRLIDNMSICDKQAK